jgi:hypothetical protein
VGREFLIPVITFIEHILTIQPTNERQGILDTVSASQRISTLS